MQTDFQAAIDLIASGKIEPTKIVTHRFPFEEIAHAFTIAADKESGAIKVHLINGQ
jgi:threonine dehydrogenase-like Zn-dependent dehydrogenase